MALHYTSDLPTHLYRAAEVRELDRIAIQEQGIPGFDLMSRAGLAAFSLLRERWPTAKRIVIVCGVGNNGGDGYVMATLAQQAGLQPVVLQLGAADKISGDALLAREQAQSYGVDILPFTASALVGDVVVDALLGTGLSGDVRSEQAAAIAAINQSGLPVLAVDIPSGLSADTGAVLGAAVRAEATITFIGMKQGLLTGAAPDQVGALYFAGLDVPDEVYRSVSATATLVQSAQVRQWLPPRSRTAHKGHHGHVLVIGGDHGMGGAVTMAAEAAGRVGAGLVTVITRPEHVTPILTRRPECMVRGTEDPAEALSRATVVVVGPGLGQHRWGQELLRQVLTSPLPVVLDADALNLLAHWRREGDPLALRGNWILTPHPGEAARLLAEDGTADISTAEIQRNRFDSLQRLQQQYAATVVLKGAGTLIAGVDGSIWISTSGNPGMGSGGMGDVLSGVIGGLLAQGLLPVQAAAAAAWIHGKAADTAAEQAGERGLLATDLMPALRHWVN